MFFFVIQILVSVAVILGLVRLYLQHSWGWFRDYNSLKGRVFIVTGANAGLGKETVRGLAIREATVIMACRDMTRTQAAIEDIRTNVQTGELIPMEMDLTSIKSIKTFSEEVLRNFPNIHVLINNAGVRLSHETKEKTKDGFEIHFGVNHLGHFLLTNLLLDRLKTSAPSRVIIVSSRLHERGVIDFDNLQGEKGFPNTLVPAYCNSKLANAYFCQELARRTAGTGVEVFSLCPGLCYTGMLSKAGDIKWYHIVTFAGAVFFYMRSTVQGSQTILLCAAADSAKLTSGQFYVDCKPYKSLHKFTPETGVKLWEVSEELISKALKHS